MDKDMQRMVDRYGEREVLEWVLKNARGYSALKSFENLPKPPEKTPPVFIDEPPTSQPVSQPVVSSSQPSIRRGIVNEYWRRK